jgi:hypothetical protein
MNDDENVSITFDIISVIVSYLFIMNEICLAEPRREGRRRLGGSASRPLHEGRVTS